MDREACAHYKHALDQFLPPEYSEVVSTGSNNDSSLLKEFHLDPKKERQIRKSFGKLDQQPKILIVTEKLLTGFDGPVLYAMYLDKPMRDHTLLQPIARVNRPYERRADSLVRTNRPRRSRRTLPQNTPPRTRLSALLKRSRNGLSEKSERVRFDDSSAGNGFTGRAPSSHHHRPEAFPLPEPARPGIKARL